MAECGGVGGSGKSGAGSSVGASGGANSVGGKSSESNKSASVGKTDAQNTEAKTNNTEGAKAKAGIDREPQQKADLNGKVEAAKTKQTKAEQTKAEQTKAEKNKTEKAKAAQAQTQSFTETIKEKAKEVMEKATEIAKTVKQEFAKAAEKVQKQKELAELARNPKVGAMLDTLGFTEGTNLNYGKVVNGTVIGQNRKDMPYDSTLTAGMKNVSTLDMSQHPNVSVRWAKGQKPSSAAGRYQMLSGTWKELSDKLGLTNFHATTQDIAAVQKMKDLGMVDAVLNDDLKTAVTLGSGTWASLPKADGTGTYKGQSAKSFEAIENAYNNFLHEREWKSQINDFN